jgi:hypothetical protein
VVSHPAGQAVRGTLARLSLRLAFGVFALAVALAGAGFLCAALYMALAESLRPALAALITGIVVLATAVILLLRARSAMGGRPATGGGGTTTGAGPQSALDLGSAVGADVQSWVKGHAPQATVAALLLGVALGISPRLRRVLWRLLR